MKASKQITLAALGVLSLTVVAGCGEDAPRVTADCVARDPGGAHRPVNEKNCNTSGSAGRGGGGAYVWVYGGTPGADGRIRGGTLTRPRGAAITSRSGTVISRGGFGGRGGGGS